MRWIKVYCGREFYWWRKSEYPEKTTDLPQVSDKLYHIINDTSCWQFSSKHIIKASSFIFDIDRRKWFNAHYSNWHIIKRVSDLDHFFNNIFHESHSLVGKTPCSYGQDQKEQVVLTRCRIGHGSITHSYLLNTEERPECIACTSIHSLKHVLIDYGCCWRSHKQGIFLYKI
jgi:hypothetical protein